MKPPNIKFLTKEKILDRIITDTLVCFTVLYTICQEIFGYIQTPSFYNVDTLPERNMFNHIICKLSYIHIKFINCHLIFQFRELWMCC